MFEYILQIFIGILVMPGFETKSIQNKTDEEDSLIGVIAKLENKIDNLTRIVNEGKQIHEKPVLFFVRLSKTITLNKDSIVKFDEVMLNEGNHFNSGDGIFVSPVTGIFQFTWTLLTTTSQVVETELMVDNVVVDTLIAALYSSGNISGTKIVLCKVKKGDHVWIQTSSVYTSNYFYKANAAKSSFTGMLIYTY
ncbi:complement C1q tumor necrosis factor-related protein 2-like [Mytilus trossulus]|uniref:complement C1q tumor necrosis factor-related protein 2-like n=1 Tax=Mytilus trossulus TaxID=6551 RepID=UPI003004F57A